MRAAALLLWCALLAPSGAAAQPLEHEVKAAYLFRFLSFMEWPGQPGRAEAPIVIGVLGADEVLEPLQEIVSARNVGGRPVAVRRVREGEPLAGLQVLFVGRAAAAALPRLGAPPGTAIVSDADSALDRGAAIAFVRSEGRIRFHVALDNAERQNVRISSRMLGVAEHVRGRRS